MQTVWLWSVARYLHLGTDRRAGVIDGKPFCPRFEDFLRPAVGQAVSDPLTAADALDRLSAAGVCGSVFCVIVASFDRATMSRKFCLLNQTNSISWALMPDRRNQPHSLLVRPRHIASVRRACYRRVKSVRPRVPDGRPSGKSLHGVPCGCRGRFPVTLSGIAYYPAEKTDMNSGCTSCAPSQIIFNAT